MRIKLSLLGLMSVCLSAQAYALTEKDFTELEYHVNTKVDNLLPYASGRLTREFKNAFEFIDFDNDPTIRLVTFLDTPDRAFNDKNLIIRVREHINKPERSRVTVKLRAEAPDKFPEIKHYRKAEIDITGDHTAYSVSYDIPYFTNDIDVKEVDVKKVFNLIKTNKDAWDLISDVYSANRQDIQQTMVMRTQKWSGSLTDPSFKKAEIDFQMWTPFYRKPRVTFAELSFKGKTKDQEQLKLINDYLIKQTGDFGIGHQNSKTKATFDMTEGFN